MNLRYALLGLLCAGPASGLDLVRRFSHTAGYAWSAHHSQIYPELARCLREGLIEEVGAGPRGKRVYRTTAVGTDALRGWLLSPDVDRTVRSEPTLRSFFTWLIDAEERATLYGREAEYHRSQLAELERIRDASDDLSTLEGPRLAARITLERGLRFHATMIEWATWAAEATRGGSAVASVPADKDGQ